MDFLKLIVLKIFRRYPNFKSALPHSITMLPFGSVSSRQNVHFICKHFMNNSHPALTEDLSAHCGVANIVFDKA